MNFDNISFVIEDTETNNEKYVNGLFNMDNMANMANMNNIYLKEDRYNSCTIKQLLLISDYYNLTKKYKLSKSNKLDIIIQIVLFETNPKNNIIVNRRKTIWFYVEEIKNDKTMSKYILL